jgi:hypothetical protein
MEKAIAKELEALKNNSTIREFVETEATRKIADEINNKPGRCCTFEAAAILIHKHDNIKKRWAQYVAAGYVAVMMEKYNAA